jgi:hypothetical protein
VAARRSQYQRVEVIGLRDVRNAIKAAEAEAPQELKKVMREAAELVVEKIRPQVPRGKTGKAARSYKAKPQTAGASIGFGGRAAEYAPWLDFGGTVGKGHIPGRPYSGSVVREYLGRPYGVGRYLYPTIEETIEDVQDLVVEGLQRVITQYGMKIEGID